MNDPCEASDLEMEQLVLQESIVSATGLNACSLQISLKGDPSLRETSLARPKYASPVDGLMPQLLANVEELLRSRSTYRVYIGFNSGEVRTNSIFDPLRVEVHAGAKMAERAYIDRHFPPIPYEEKVAFMRGLYDYMLGCGILDKLPDYWRRIFTKRHAAWQPMEPERIHTIVASLAKLRGLPDLYLRNVTLCIVQDLVRMQFNCDGTHIVSAENYQKFLEENF